MILQAYARVHVTAHAAKERRARPAPQGAVRHMVLPQFLNSSPPQGAVHHDHKFTGEGAHHYYHIRTFLGAGGGSIYFLKKNAMFYCF
jgi:hypothetical protein